MSFLEDNASYENWLRGQCAVVEADLEYKHERMKKNAFLFLRATYFRWARKIGELRPELADAPAILAVGDAHLENFGTWRDAEGRFVWGVNDFDDAAVMPYAFDLVRLGVSARLAPGLAIKGREAAAAILAGYRRGLAEPRPTLPGALDAWMQPFVAPSELGRRRFWKEIDALPEANPPDEVKEGFKVCLPDGAEIVRFATRSKGGGSLGRPRFAALAEWRGGRIVREAKALVPSGWDWAHGKKSAKSHFLDLAASRYRAPDPFLSIHNGFVFRRLSASSRKLDLAQDIPPRLEALFLEAMSFDLGSIHATDRKCRKIPSHLDSMPADWLHRASKVAAEAVEKDFEKWMAACSGSGA